MKRKYNSKMRLDKNTIRNSKINIYIFRPVRKILSKILIVFKTNYYVYKKDKSSPRILLLFTPDHSNIGDQMITLAEYDFFNEIFNSEQKKHFYEFTFEEWKIFSKKIIKNINENDLIFIHGGGFLGSFYGEIQKEMIFLLRNMKNNKIIIMPQTIYFENTKIGKVELAKFKEAMKECSRLTVFTRDKRSHDLALHKLEVGKDHCFMVPDIVTYCEKRSNIKREKRIMIIMRNDCEKVCNEDKLKFLSNMKELEDYEIIKTDMYHSSSVNARQREKVVQKKLDEFSKASLIITDRLHGMLFSAITGTPCIAFDNKSKKVSGQYEWIKYLPYVKQKDIESISEKDILEMLSITNNNYSNKPLKQYYSLMEDIIKGEL